jgi:hypothetical protein
VCTLARHFLSRPFRDAHLRERAVPPHSGPIGDTLRGSEVGDVGGINQEDVLAKQGEEHVRDPLEINLSMFSLYRSAFSLALARLAALKGNGVIMCKSCRVKF